MQCSINGLKILFLEKAAKREILLIFFSFVYVLIMKPEIYLIIWLIVLPLIILSIEALNTAIEYTCDEITMNKSKKIKKAKDLGSAAILLALFSYGVVIALSLINSL